MEEKNKPITSSCNFSDVRPIMMDLPYPSLGVKEKNPVYAGLLSADYCGSVSELSAIVQYINYENRLSCERCPTAKTILGIAMAEMIHLQKLGELIVLLGGTIDFSLKQRDGQQKVWTAQYLKLQDNARGMLLAGIESERAAINQYRMHMRVINDNFINATLSRIIMDEEYHIMLLQELVRQLSTGIPVKG